MSDLAPGQPLVSVLMAAYNAEATVGEALQSIQAQMLTDFEFIIVDDGSTDATGGILERAAEHDRRIVLLHNERNAGLIPSLNKGLARARGHYLARMDADDVSDPTRLQKQAAFLGAHPDIGVLGTGYERLYSDGSRSQHHPSADYTEIRWRLLFDSIWPHPAVMFRASLLGPGESYGDFPHAEDYELWARLCARTRATTLPEVLITIRTHDTGGISARHRAAQLAMVCTISRRELARIAGEDLPLDLHDVEALRRLQAVATAESHDLRLAPRTLRLLDHFALLPDIDAGVLRRVRRSWIRRILYRSVAASWYGELWRSGFLGAVARRDPGAFVPGR